MTRKIRGLSFSLWINNDYEENPIYARIHFLVTFRNGSKMKVGRNVFGEVVWAIGRSDGRARWRDFAIDSIRANGESFQTGLRLAFSLCSNLDHEPLSNWLSFQWPFDQDLFQGIRFHARILFRNSSNSNPSKQARSPINFRSIFTLMAFCHEIHCINFSTSIQWYSVIPLLK